VRREFAAWIETEDGRRVEAEVTRRARELAARGKRRGIAALFESIRYDSEVGLIGGGEYLLNNDHRAHLARRVMERNADLAGFFEVRAERGVA
jgi:hypothetical protein